MCADALSRRISNRWQSRRLNFDLMESSMTEVPASENPPPQPPPAAPATADKPLIPYDVFAQVDLRVATVLEAREHPNANKLLLLQIQVGEVRKQIVAGIRGHYEPAALVGRQIIIVNNLEPAMLRGEESNGMLLAATDENGVVLLRPDREMTSGSKVK
jgi:methionyl-tRNA synthetase